MLNAKHIRITMKIAKRLRRQVKQARSVWGRLDSASLESLLELLKRHHLSITSGDLSLIGGGWYVTHAGLLRLAIRNQCLGIRVQPAKESSEIATSRYAFKAI